MLFWLEVGNFFACFGTVLKCWELADVYCRLVVLWAV